MTKRPTTDETKTTSPLFFARIPGKKARFTRNGPTTFVANCASTADGVNASSIPKCPVPALLTRTSIAPASARIVAAAAATEASLVTSRSTTETPAAASYAAACAFLDVVLRIVA
jgi:hypothetical protein